MAQGLPCQYLTVIWTLAIGVVLQLSKTYAVYGTLSNPRIVEHPEDVYVGKNEPATLNCKAEGEPPPIITWYRRGVPVITANENPTSHRMLLPSGQLFFLRVQHNAKNQTDVGVYYCNATNPETRVSVISHDANLDVATIRDEFREQPPLSVDVAVGADTSIPCKPPRGKPEPKVRWKKDSESLKYSDRIVLEESGTLRIHDARKNDSGVYICVGHNVGGEKESMPCQLSVKERPRIIEGPKDVTVQESADVLFNCQTSSLENDVTVIWKKEDGQIPPGRSRILEDRSLRIERADLSDEGVYVCRVENSVGFQEAEARLFVHTQPSFIVTPQDRIVGVGRRVSFRCQVTGNPVPAVFWSKESAQKLMFPNYDNGRFSVMDDGTLVIESVQKEDAGEYVCKGLSIAGSAYAKARLTVRDVDPRPPPIIHQGPQNQTLPVNSLALLPCLATGNPAPSIRWYKNYKELQMRDPRFVLLDSGALQISDLRKTDTGVYTCRAVSETGETARGAALIVETPSNPAVIFHRTPEPSTFPGAPSKPSVSEITENSVRLTWRPSTTHGASPIVAYTVEYFSHDTLEGWIVASDTVTETTYVVHNLRADTSYMFLVRAQNSHGLSLPSPVTQSVKTKALVTEKLRSSQLISLPRQLEAINSTAVRVSWELRSRVPPRSIDGYCIHYRVSPGLDQAPAASETDTSSTFSKDCIRDGGVTSHVIGGLLRYTYYEVRVQPLVQGNAGLESSSATVRTLQDVPTAAPLNLQFHYITNSSIQLSWEPPDKFHRNGILLGYKIFIYNNDTGFYQKLTANASDTAIVVTNIVKDEPYNVCILAYNSVGDGVASYTVIGSSSGVHVNVMQQPWFIATIIATIGGALWFALCVFSVWLCRRRKNWRKQAHTNGVISVPVHKTDTNARNCYLANSNDIQRRPLPIHSTMQQQQPDITRGTVIDTKPEIAGFMLPGTSSFAPPTDSMFRPINQAYMIQSPPSYQLSGPGGRDETAGLLGRNPSSSGMNKQPTLFLPPPPLHPPPPGADQHHQLSTDDTCDDDNIYSRIPALSSDGADSYYNEAEHPYADDGRAFMYVGTNAVCSQSPAIAARHPQMAKFSTASPKLVHRVFDQVRSYSPRAASEPEPCPPTPPQFKIASSVVAIDRRAPYSDGESSLVHHGHTVSPPSPAPGCTELPMMDRSMQSSLPSLMEERLHPVNMHRHNEAESPTSEVVEVPDYSGLSEIGGYSVGRPDSEEMSDVGQRDCHSPVSSIDEMERAVADSVLASWADAIDGNVVDNGADVSAVAVPDSDVSSNSDSSDPDALFFAEADFAVAVQRAAEKSGLMVVGSTVMDPNYGPREKVKRPAKRRQRAPRPASPYSTDSNYSSVQAVVPHRPYPKSERRKQIAGRQGHRHHRQTAGNQSNNATAFGPPSMSPSSRPAPAVNNNPSVDSSVASYHPPLSSRLPVGNERMIRTNPLDAFDTRDTPIV